MHHCRRDDGSDLRPFTYNITLPWTTLVQTGLTPCGTVTGGTCLWVPGGNIRETDFAFSMQATSNTRKQY